MVGSEGEAAEIWSSSSVGDAEADLESCLIVM